MTDLCVSDARRAELDSGWRFTIKIHIPKGKIVLPRPLSAVPITKTCRVRISAAVGFHK
jgi:hypothetical protein